MLSLPTVAGQASGRLFTQRGPNVRKPGRPREDGFRRRLEIYTAVAPLLEKDGAGGLTMRQAADAAHVSVGGITTIPLQA